jgi:hypothetical protein
MGDVDGELLDLAGGDQLARQRVAVAGDVDPDAGAGVLRAIVEHTEADGLVLADDAEARGLVDDEAAIPEPSDLGLPPFRARRGPGRR